MKMLKLIFSLLLLVMVAGCGEEEECQNKVLPFFDGEEYVTETLVDRICFYERTYYCKGEDVEYLFFCYSYDAEEWFSIPELIEDKNGDGKISSEESIACNDYLRTLVDKNQDGIIDAAESQRLSDIQRHYAEYTFAINKADYIRMGGKDLKQGQKVTMTVDLTNVKGYYKVDYCGDVAPTIGYMLWSSHLGIYVGSHVRNAYLKTIHK